MGWHTIIYCTYLMTDLLHDALMEHFVEGIDRLRHKYLNDWVPRVIIQWRKLKNIDQLIFPPDSFKGIIIMVRKDIQIIQREKLFVKWWQLVILTKANVKIFWIVPRRHSASQKKISLQLFWTFYVYDSLPI